MDARNRLQGGHAAAATVWTLEQASGQFSELVSLAEAGLPQHITRCGQPAVVVISAADYARLDPNAASAALLQPAGKRFARLEDFDPAEAREHSPIRDIPSFDP